MDGTKRAAEDAPDAPDAKRQAMNDVNQLLSGNMLMSAFFGGVRGQRALKGSMTKSLNKMAAADWAAGADARPFQLRDLADPAKSVAARAYYDSLSHEQIKLECQSHGVPKTGAKYKLLQALEKHARSARNGNARGAVGEGGVARVEANADKVRKALVADLRKCLNWDKKMKRTDGTVKKRLSAKYEHCGPAVFDAIFPHAAGKKSAKLAVAQLGVDAIAKSMRYGGRLVAVDGSLSAKRDDAGTISVSGMYTYRAW